MQTLTNAATSGGHSPRNAARSGWKSVVTKNGWSSSSSARTSPFRSSAATRRLARCDLREELRVQSIAAVIALCDFAASVSLADARASAKGHGIVDLDQRALEWRDHAPLRVRCCLAHARRPPSRARCARIRSPRAGSRRRCRGMGAGFRARSESRCSAPSMLR